jgi:hypothetical protein
MIGMSDIGCGLGEGATNATISAVHSNAPASSGPVKMQFQAVAEGKINKSMFDR